MSKEDIHISNKYTHTKKMVISLVIRKIQIIIRYNFAFTGMTKSKKIKGYSDQKKPYSDRKYNSNCLELGERDCHAQRGMCF